MRLTHKARILVYLRSRQPNWVSSVEIERQSIEWGCKGQTIDRRCRELRVEGRIQSKMVDGTVWYRLTQSEPVQVLKVVDNTKLFDLPIKIRI